MKYSRASNTILGIFAATTTATMSSAQECQSPPERNQLYSVLENTVVSSDSHILTVGLPENRELLGWNKNIPTCISVSYYNKDEITEKGDRVLAKSYSPISHPNQADWFQLLVKAYPPQKGGGVGAYLCGLQPGDTFQAKVKAERIMHSSPAVLGRWKHVGLVAGGTGIAPLYQIITMLLLKDQEQDEDCKIHVLSINRKEEDILMKTELDQLVQDHPDRVFVTYSLTGQDGGDTCNSIACEKGRGTVDLVRQALPDPSNNKKDVMVLVCGKDGFVEFWAGKVGRAPPKADGSKGAKIQGPLMGVLKEAGFSADQVFKY